MIETPPDGFYRVRTMEEIPKRCGVYIFYDDGKIQYVGRTNILRTRIKNHIIFRMDGIATYIKVDDRAKTLERELICKLNPPLNQITGVKSRKNGAGSAA